MSVDIIVKNRNFKGVDAVVFDTWGTLIDFEFEGVVEEVIGHYDFASTEEFKNKPTVYNALRLMILNEKEVHIKYNSPIRRYTGDMLLKYHVPEEEIIYKTVISLLELKKKVETGTNLEDILYFPKRATNGKDLTTEEREKNIEETQKKLDDVIKGIYKRIGKENVNDQNTIKQAYSEEQKFLSRLLIATEENIRINQNALNFIGKLKDQGVKVGLISDTSSFYKPCIDILLKICPFDATVFSYEQGRKKWQERGQNYTEIAEKLQTEPDKIIMI
ncbi:hypothetical protein GF327_10185 [Candidatus Woesearchaeota archaeon]|nr:hypothetical protein [Candidatus Woesearchaeota archaeon]